MGSVNYSYKEYNNLLYFGTKIPPYSYYQFGAEIKTKVGGHVAHMSRHEMILHADVRQMKASGTDEVTNYNSFINYPFKIVFQTGYFRGGLLYQYSFYKGRMGSMHTLVGAFAGYHFHNNNTASQLNGTYQYRDLRFTFGEGIMAGIGWRHKHLNILLCMDTYNVKNTVWRPLMNLKSSGIQVGYVF